MTGEALGVKQEDTEETSDTEMEAVCTVEPHHDDQKDV